jgi:hypothetical protein
MRAETVLLRESGERPLPPAFVAESHPFHRPKTRYRLRINSPNEVEPIRRTGLPISVFSPEKSEELGYPLEFKPRVIIAKELRSAVDTSLPIVSFADTEAAKNPKLEDYIVAMLRIDLIGARRITSVNREKIGNARLLKRVLQENLESQAYRVRLDEFAPGLPQVPGVKPIARAVLIAEDSREYSR